MLMLCPLTTLLTGPWTPDPRSWTRVPEFGRGRWQLRHEPRVALLPPALLPPAFAGFPSSTLCKGSSGMELFAVERAPLPPASCHCQDKPFRLFTPTETLGPLLWFSLGYNAVLYIKLSITADQGGFQHLWFDGRFSTSSKPFFEGVICP